MDRSNENLTPRPELRASSGSHHSSSSSPHTSSAAPLVEVGLLVEEAFPAELRSPKGRFLRPENDEQDYHERSPAMVAAQRQREANRRAMKSAVPCVALDDSSEKSGEASLSRNKSFGTSDDKKQGGGDIEECCDAKHHCNNLMIMNNNNNNKSCGWKIKMGCAVVTLMVYTLSVFSAGIALGARSAPYVQQQQQEYSSSNNDSSSNKKEGEKWVIKDDDDPSSPLRYNPHPLSPSPEDDEGEDEDETYGDVEQEDDDDDDPPVPYKERPLSPYPGANTQEEHIDVEEHHPLSPYPGET